MDFQVIKDLLKLAAESGASDIVIKSHKPGYVRLNGRLRPVEMDPIAPETAKSFVDASVPPGFKAQWEKDGQIDFAFILGGTERFRVNAFHQRGTVSIVFRHIKGKVPNFEELQLHSANTLIKMVQAKDGILLICGATGSGKSTTMAAMLNWVNQNLDKHIVTLEDPIEFTFQDNRSVFQQREIGIDSPTFELAIKAVLRQNPDIILIGEMRDRTTFETAISAAETGHLVFSTMHAATVQQAITRLFEFFEPEHQEQARRQVAGALRGIICQKLVPSLEGGGRTAVHEILVVDSVIRNFVLEGQFDKIPSQLDGSTESGSQSFNKDLLRLIKAGKISKGDGIKASPNPQALEMNLKGIFVKT